MQSATHPSLKAKLGKMVMLEKSMKFDCGKINKVEPIVMLIDKLISSEGVGEKHVTEPVIQAENDKILR